jgi:D-alanine-D-alanine ligase
MGENRVGSGRKLTVGLLFGGRSAEHEISILSARNVFEAIDKEKYDVVLIGIDPDGRWSLREPSIFSAPSVGGALPALQRSERSVALLPYPAPANLVGIADSSLNRCIDAIFPVLHGMCGEDGTIQGLITLAGIPFVGPGVLGSAVCMDKDAAKRLMREAGIPTARHIAVRASARSELEYRKVTEKLGSPVFVKPANTGSSVGVKKVCGAEEFDAAVEEAFRFDAKIVIEEAIAGRELECAVLGNEDPRASGVGEIIPNPRHGFYSYQAKYLDDQGAKVAVPADVESGIVSRVQELAVRAFQALCCEGMARVDFFLRPGGEILVNELNTIPGFTSISMYPKLWRQSGVSYPELIDRLIQFAVERAERERALKTSY